MKASDIIFAEFIPEAHERLIKNEAAALFNFYETINRNRELDGNVSGFIKEEKHESK